MLLSKLPVTNVSNFICILYNVRYIEYMEFKVTFQAGNFDKSQVDVFLSF